MATRETVGTEKQIVVKIAELRDAMNDLTAADDYNSLLYFWHNHPWITSVADFERTIESIELVLQQVARANEMKAEFAAKNQELLQNVRQSA